MHYEKQDEYSSLINHENSTRGSLIKLGFDSSMGTLTGKRETPCAQSRGKSMNRTIRYPMQNLAFSLSHKQIRLIFET